jgi:type IV secretory pathway VirB2 component (pilin)
MKKLFPALITLVFLGVSIPHVLAQVNQNQYEWTGQFTVNVSLPGQTVVAEQGGPFATQQACYNSQNTVSAQLSTQYPTVNGNGGVDLIPSQCTCNSTISQQPSCPGSTTAPTPAPATPTPTPAAPSPAPTPAAAPAPAATTGSGFVALAPIPGLTQGATANSTSLATFLQNLYKFLIGIAAVLAIIQIIRGGLEYATQDSVSKKGDGKKHIQQAILGLVLVLSPVLVFTLINPSILNLSLNLPALNTATASSTPAAATPAAGNGQVTGVYLQKLVGGTPAQISSFQSACGAANGILANSCPTVNAQTGTANCTGPTTLECENIMPPNQYNGGSSETIWLAFGPSNPSFLQALQESALTTALVPGVAAEVPEDTQFVNQCTSDGGEVCTTDGHVNTPAFVTGDAISCGPTSGLPAYSQPVNTVPYCWKVNLLCADPNLASGVPGSTAPSVCNTNWSFQLSLPSP